MVLIEFELLTDSIIFVNASYSSGGNVPQRVF